MCRYRIYFSKLKWDRRKLILETDYREVAKEIVKMLREKYPADRFFIEELYEAVIDYE